MTRKEKPIQRAAAWAAGILPTSVKQALYKTPLLAGFIRRRLNAATPEGEQVTTISGGVLKGMRFSLNLQSEKDYWLGTYEMDLQAAAQHFIHPGMVVYDVGANAGYISLMASRLVGKSGKVVAIEALPVNITRLRKNIQLNGLCDQVIIIEGAAIDHSGEVAFLAHASGAMGKAAGSAGRETDYLESIQVSAHSLDDLVFKKDSPEPDVIKMDIEGGEILAVEGLTKILKKCQPVLLIELHGEKAARAVWEKLQTHGYQICQMQQGYPLVQTLDELDWKAYIVAKPKKNAI